MTEQKIDAIILAGGTSLNYFTGIRWGNSERLFAVVIPKEGNPYVVCPGFEEDRAREQLASGPLARTDVRTWHEDESPFERVAQGLKDRRVGSGRLGVEETTKFVFGDGIASAAPGLHLASATPVTAGCRMIKDTHELELMRLASHVTLKAYEAVYRALSEGMTQSQVGTLMSAAYERLGFPGFASVQVDTYTALPHGSIAPQTIREGTIIMIDDGCSVEEYQSDITRTFVLGKASPAQRKAWDVVRAAYEAAVGLARPGVPCRELHRVSSEIIESAGYRVAHRIGHGIGLATSYEWPSLDTEESPLEPGVTICIEPGVYAPGAGNMKLEDDFVITEDGCEILTRSDQTLELNI